MEGLNFALNSYDTDLSPCYIVRPMRFKFLLKLHVESQLDHVSLY